MPVLKIRGYTMKFIIIPLILLSAFCYSESREVLITQAEYSEISQKGYIRTANCSRCNHELYNFDHTLEVVHLGSTEKKLSIQDLLTDYHKSTLFVITTKDDSNKLNQVFYSK
jgi:hypothetical protein